jgi:hypothetical protein
MISIKKKRALAKDHNSVFVSTASDLEGSIFVIDDNILSEVVCAFGSITGGCNGTFFNEVVSIGGIEGTTEGIAIAIFPTVIEQPNIGNIHIVNRIIELFM